MVKEKETVSATSKYIRISPSKVDIIISKIRGKTYKEALQIWKYLPQKSGAIVWQTLYSAVSNATNNFDLEKIAPFIHNGNYAALIEACEKSMFYIYRNANPKITFTNLCIDLMKNLQWNNIRCYSLHHCCLFSNLAVIFANNYWHSLMKLTNLLSLVAILAVATSCDYQKNNTIKQKDVRKGDE